MIINLTQSVGLKEICKISVMGTGSESADMVEFELSHEALVGFATELIWLYEDMKGSEKMVINTNQLKVDPSPNQTIGFYLTPNSPMFVLKVNSLSEGEKEEYEYKNYKEINIRTKNINQHFNVQNLDEKNYLERCGFICLEPYELSRKNIMNIRILDKDKKNVTSCYCTVFFEINYSGIKEFATMLLILANNYRNGQEYQFAHVCREHEGYNLGVILLKESMQAKIRCADLGNAYEYDSSI